MNILVIGSGGREHALGWKLKQSPKCDKLYFAPGNGGTAALGENIDINADTVNRKTIDAINYFCKYHDIGMIVIGPEDPLAGGLADALKQEGRIIFGPCKDAARIEGDKAFSKQLMRGASVPTAEARIFNDMDKALTYVHNQDGGMVVKAAGLAKGKGVIVCPSTTQAAIAVERIMHDHEFGEAGDTIVIEEMLTGQEVSVLALVDGQNIYVLDPAQDHKQAHEGDTGPNTGGMGAYCPTPLMNEELMHFVESEVLVPTVDAFKREGVVYQGVLYAGLMLTPGGPKVLEFNCRFGDPEVQPLMVRLQGDMVDIMTATATGKLDEIDLSWDERCCCCVVLASGGYPGSYEKGKVITGIEDAEADPDVTVFHAGTKLDKAGNLVTNGGRVLNVCALGKDLKEAQTKANAACEKIKFEGAFYRHDIGYRVMPPE